MSCSPYSATTYTHYIHPTVLRYMSNTAQLTKSNIPHKTIIKKYMIAMCQRKKRGITFTLIFTGTTV